MDDPYYSKLIFSSSKLITLIHYVYYTTISMSMQKGGDLNSLLYLSFFVSYL